MPVVLNPTPPSQTVSRQQFNLVDGRPCVTCGYWIPHYWWVADHYFQIHGVDSHKIPQEIFDDPNEKYYQYAGPVSVSPPDGAS